MEVTVMFSEVYSAYFNAVAAILREAVQGNMTEKRMTEIVNEKAFTESFIVIIPALRNEEWLLLNRAGQTPIKKPPQMPLTLLQKRWLKALLTDPRLTLFAPDLSGLEYIEPLFNVDDFVYFDRYSDGDPFSDGNYINNFHLILQALRELRKLKISYSNRIGRRVTGTYNPWKLEYSAKDDKFRLLTNAGRISATINIGRITACELLVKNNPSILREPRQEASITFELTDERNALDRVMPHFSDCRKETSRLDDKHYHVTLWYDSQDETEILIRVLSFGQMIRVTSPESFINLIKERIIKQKDFFRR
jgi:hypothetical protein